MSRRPHPASRSRRVVAVGGGVALGVLGLTMAASAAERDRADTRGSSGTIRSSQPVG